MITLKRPLIEYSIDDRCTCLQVENNSMILPLHSRVPVKCILSQNKCDGPAFGAPGSLTLHLSNVAWLQATLLLFIQSPIPKRAPLHPLIRIFNGSIETVVRVVPFQRPARKVRLFIHSEARSIRDAYTNRKILGK